MLLIKYKGNLPSQFPLPANFKLLAGQTFVFGEGNLSSYAPSQIREYHIKEITDPALISRLNLNNHTIHTDGTVRLYGTGEHWLGEPLVGVDLGEFLIGARYLAKINAAAAYENQFNALAKNESQLEQATWAQQLSEALAYLSNNAFFAPLLTQLAEARNITVAQYAQHVVDANAAYAQSVNALVVNLKEQYQAIDNAGSPQALKDTGWI